MRLNLQVKLYPTKQMRTYLDSQCDYRRYCWNKGLEVWNDFYDQRMISLPTELKLKIKESLKDKSIQFTEEEMNLRKEFPSPTERHVRNESSLIKAIGNTKILLVYCNSPLRICRTHGYGSSRNLKTVLENRNSKVARNQNKVLKRIEPVSKTTDCV